MAGTTSIARVNKRAKSPMVAPIPLSINPRGSRELGQTVSHAPRLHMGKGDNARDYGKKEPGGFQIPGL